jgi:hypothetical protein
MSALIYINTSDQITLASDTLSVDFEKQPILYCSKILLVPHLKTVICGTGFKSIISNWHEIAQNKIIGYDISSLNYHATKQLQSSKHDIQGDLPGTTTIYHFGYNESEHCLKGYAFRSENDFAQEDLEKDSLGVKPYHVEIIPFYQDLATKYPVGSSKFLIEIIIELRRLDNLLPNCDKVGIGGEIQYLKLFGKGDFSFETIYQFPDFYEIYSTILNQNDQISFGK